MIHDLVLATHGVRLEPLAPEHAPALLALVDPDLWFGMTSPVPTSVADVEAWVDAARRADGTLAFAVVGEDDGEVRGSTRFYDLVPAQGRVEIGTTFYGRAWWGGVTNPACKLLLFRHAFETWGLRRVALRADARNTRSCAAIRRLGATPEGVLRRHRVAADGSVGDTAYFSVVDDEWPDVRAGLEQRLAAFA
ncbi:GNAT family N-acetyltransferase [Isoptericola variabilis]|uniref:Acetyltransferase n=1 Tax=Isoptericola variabilis (strain 225) TaxID=743718 RepID=F6FSY8_ISOV2|nr:GNAT family protein [Isoptericola variabilis]AEG43129.1 acetyltransferase [Isoptericola variabilis 225]